jgi:hypothetical protein
MSTPNPVPETVNPYRAPESTPGEEDWIAPADPAMLRRERKYAAIGRVMVTWEKLRVVYNATLGLTVIAVGVTLIGVSSGGVWVFRVATLGAVVANVCFCAGPVVDGYLTWLGFRSPIITGVLFVAGTSLAMLLALTILLNPGF